MRFIALLLLFPIIGIAQETITLEDCYRLTRENYPTVKKLDLVAKTEGYTLANANRAYLPQVSILGQATYQSEVTDLSKSVAGVLPLPPNVSLPTIDKEQYKVVGEVSQLLYGGGATRSQKAVAKAQSAVQAQAVETQLYTLKQRVSNLYFGVLLIDAQLSQNRLNIETLESQLRKAEVALKNGTTLPSNVDELKAEILRVTMQTTEYEASQATYLQMLSTFIGKELTSASNLVQPAPQSQSQSVSTDIFRPELKGFQLQESLLKVQEKQLNTEFLPKLSAFFQGGYGRPTLNILNNQADFYYITGLRLQWNLSPLYNLSSKRHILHLNRESLIADRQAFLLNTKLELTQQSQQIKKLQKLIEQDETSVTLRHSVAKAAEVQLDNGVITALAALIACNSKPQFDASGNFTADEVIVSAQQTGQLIAYELEEGKTLSEGQKVGQINVEVLKLQKEQVEATISSLKEKTLNPADQVAFIRSQYEVQKAQLEQQERELTRVRQLVAGGAATQKQLDDLTALVDQLRKQLAVTQNQLKVSLTNINTQNRNVLSQEAPLQKNAQAVQEQINQGEIINPVAGTVLVNYALKGEMQTFGKPLYKIANTDVLTLKAYITGDQLTQIKLGQQVTVRTDAGEGAQHTYQGKITHISNKAEFTPKTIQTKSERANLVYAIKVKVKNDGYLKIGMYGEVVF